jgi:arylsulfatase A-like enzyme
MWLAAALGAGAPMVAMAVRPNIVIVYADDLGFGDVSRYAALYGTANPASTPNLDRLADEGLLFTQAHSANAVCTPSRYSLLTGIYNWRRFQSISWHYGYLQGVENIPPAGDVTLAEWLRDRGYDTAAFGKWHLGGKWYAPGTNTRITNNPAVSSAVDWTRRIEGHATDIGFTTFRGMASALNMPPYVYLRDDRVQVWVEDTNLNQYGSSLPNGRKGYFRPATTNDTFTWFTTATLDSTVVGAKDSREGLGDPSYRQIDADPILVADFERFMDERAASGTTNPLFAYVALHSPHAPWAITPAFNNATNGAYDYARYIAEVDHRIGRIIAALDNNGMQDNTLVLFTADNGVEVTGMSRSLAQGDDPNGPLRGVKRDVWDGGTRVPFIARWPGRVPAGATTNALVSQVGVFPTIAAILGEALPPGVATDGESFLPVLTGRPAAPSLRGGIVLCSMNGHLALKTPDGWKLVDSTGGGGNATTWNAANQTIVNAIGTDRGVPKQLYRTSADIGEVTNHLTGFTSNSAIRAELVRLTGRDLLGTLDYARAGILPPQPDTDGDGVPDLFESHTDLYRSHQDTGTDPAAPDSDGDGWNDGDEIRMGTDPNNPDFQPRSANLVEHRLPLGGAVVVSVNGSKTNPLTEIARATWTNAGALFVRQRGYDTTTQHWRARCYLAFDLAPLAGHPVQAARLTLRQIDRLNSTTFNSPLAVSRVESAWDLSGTNYPLYAASTALSRVIGTNNQFGTNQTSQGTYTGRVTDIMHSWSGDPWTEAAPHHGFQVALTDTQFTGVAFSEAVGERPELAVTVYVRDGDGDGVDDAWEQWRFNEVVFIPPDRDSDDDGFPDVDEFRAGTDPLNGDSSLRVRHLSVGPTPAGLIFSSAHARRYSVWGATNLWPAPQWAQIAADLESTPPSNTVPIPISSDAPFTVYRIGVEPAD